MNIGVPKEIWPGERRAALVPDGVRRLVKRGAQVQVECGLGATIGATDSDYAAAGASSATDRRALLASADMVLRVRRPPPEEIEWLRPGAVHISFLDPRNEPELLRRLAARSVSTISMERMPRITRAQSMDALSSQNSLAGYVAVILAAAQLPRIFPMMMTAAGTIAPARVLVIGAGVAGLQAIATAHRLGARVEACDSRPAVEEEVRSLGARFLKLDISKTGQLQGNAEGLTDDQLMRQRQALKRFCAQADVVITAAQVFGRRAPILLTAEVLDAMRPGSIVVDLAVESGGNVEVLTPSEVTERHGVKIIAGSDLPSRVPVHASQTYSANLTALVEEFWDAASGSFCVKANDEILHACLVTHAGRVCHESPVVSPPG